jgi:hypothetical protein
VRREREVPGRASRFLGNPRRSGIPRSRSAITDLRACACVCVRAKARVREGGRGGFETGLKARGEVVRGARRLEIGSALVGSRMRKEGG